MNHQNCDTALWFWFETPSPGVVDVHMDPSMLDSTARLILQFYKEGEDLYAAAYTAWRIGAVRNSFFTSQPMIFPAGKFYIRTQTILGEGEFGLTLNFTPDSTEENQTCATAYPIQIGDTMTARIYGRATFAAEEDFDCYAFQVPADGVYHIGFLEAPAWSSNYLKITLFRQTATGCDSLYQSPLPRPLNSLLGLQPYLTAGDYVLRVDYGGVAREEDPYSFVILPD